MTPGHREWRIGTHTLRFEPPDLLRIDFRGVLTLEDAPHMVEVYRELGTSVRLYALGSMSEAEPLEPEVRHYLSEHMRPEWFHATVYFGARLVHKALIKGVVLAAHLDDVMEKAATERSLQTIHFVSTREEAEQLILQLRAQQSGLVA
ncbi:hypothetical protein [Cystobacter ferrugineus]|uniref:STAS/SEC14 domain-containing protein n=1 Tax=Cystobacter ferrugineus TaxID=83449 RepID=A0A1L9BG46_9BACT|nr:hypothetical protein [Cystobacter ferrugineus]OJH41223.1 hypothetical protein BON30_10105 [Cystobacter ferrugineus]